MDGDCSEWANLYPEEAERIIMKWSAEHPIMTNAKKFEQVFGFSFYYRFGGSDVDTAWLAEEYKGGQDNALIPCGVWLHRDFCRYTE